MGTAFTREVEQEEARVVYGWICTGSSCNLRETCRTWSQRRERLDGAREVGLGILAQQHSRQTEFGCHLCLSLPRQMCFAKSERQNGAWGQVSGLSVDWASFVWCSTARRASVHARPQKRSSDATNHS